MTTILNNFSGQVDGTALSTANSGGGSGTAFNLAAVGAAVFDDDVDFGGGVTHSALMSGTGVRFLAWTSGWTATATVYFTATFQFDDVTPVAPFNLINFLESDDTTVGCAVRLAANGQLQLRAPAVTRYTSSTFMEPGVRFRLNVRVDSSATAGHIFCQIFKGANLWGSVPDEEFGSLAANWDTGNGTVGGINVGMCSDPGQTITLNLTAVGLSDTGYPAALGEPPDLPTPLTVPGNLTAVPSSGLRSATITWTAVAEADDGYEVELQVLNPGGNPATNTDWSLVDTFPIASAATNTLVLSDTDGLDWDKDYRVRIRALTADDN